MGQALGPSAPCHLPGGSCAIAGHVPSCCLRPAVLPYLTLRHSHSCPFSCPCFLCPILINISKFMPCAPALRTSAHEQSRQR